VKWCGGSEVTGPPLSFESPGDYVTFLRENRHIRVIHSMGSRDKLRSWQEGKI
jgi:hypothetical protein